MAPLSQDELVGIFKPGSVKTEMYATLEKLEILDEQSANLKERIDLLESRRITPASRQLSVSPSMLNRSRIKM
jgi:hypothetical protein